VPDWLQLTLFGTTLFIMLIGLFGLLVPVFPGIFIIWLAALGYGLLSGFGGWGIWLFILITLLMLAGSIIDNVLINAGAVKGGASMRSMWAGIAAGILGTLLLPPFGGLVASPLVVLLLEYRRQHTWSKAFKALGGMAIGWGTAFIVRFGLGVLMIAAWVLWNYVS